MKRKEVNRLLLNWVSLSIILFLWSCAGQPLTYAYDPEAGSNLSSVNMDSLRIIYLKMFGIDITDRIRPYIKETLIDANGIMFPEGKHEFEVRIKDTEQMESFEIFKIKVN